MLKEICITLHILNPINLKETLKRTRQGSHTRRGTQAIVPSTTVEEMVRTQPMVVDLNARCAGKLDIHSTGLLTSF